MRFLEHPNLCFKCYHAASTSVTLPGDHFLGKAQPLALCGPHNFALPPFDPPTCEWALGTFLTHTRICPFRFQCSSNNADALDR